MKKILFVINTMGRAGAERARLELIKAVHKQEREIEISLLVLLNRGELFSEIPPFVKIINKNPDGNSIFVNTKLVLGKLVIKKAVCNFSFLKNAIGLFQSFLMQKKAGKIQIDKLLWKIISDGTKKLSESFDTAIAFLEGGATYYVADHVQAKNKIAFVHIEYEKSGFTPSLDHRCYNKINWIYAISYGVRDSFLHMYPLYKDKIKIFYNIINTELIWKRAIEGTGFTDHFDGFRIVTIGRLHYQKGYDMMIPVLKKLKQTGQEIRWYILGDGPQRKKIEQGIKKAGLKKDIILLGMVRNPYPYLLQCDLYVHITRYEGKSIAIEEAQVLGKAIIASDCPGNREQITHRKNGLLVPFDREKIFQAILELCKDKKQREQYGKENARLDFARKEMVTEFCNMI